MSNAKTSWIRDLVKRVNRNKTGIFKRDSELISILPNNIAIIIGDNKIYISEFIIAKIKGLIENIVGHLEISDEVLFKIPESLSYPEEILQDTRKNKKYLFININPLNEIVVEISRYESGKSEINTIHLINPGELKRLEDKFPVVYSSGGTPGFPHSCIP